MLYFLFLAYCWIGYNIYKMVAYFSGKAQVCSSFAATRVLINPDISACHELMERFVIVFTYIFGTMTRK